MILTSRCLRQWLAFSLPLIACGMVLVGVCSPALAQDAFGSGPCWGDMVDPADGLTGVTVNSDGTTTGWGANYQTTTYGTAPTLQGATNGTIAPKEFGERAGMPNARLMLGQSLCDLTTREIAAEEDVPPQDFPPMPKRISIPKEVSDQAFAKSAQKEQLDLEYEDEGEPRYLGKQRSSVYSGDLTAAERERDRARREYFEKQYSVSRETLMRSQKVDADGASNPDFTARVAALSLKYQKERQPKNAFERASFLSNKNAPSPDQDIENATKFKASIASIKPSALSPIDRQKLAEKLESKGAWYESLPERLRLVDINDDGPSRFYLARVYLNIGEHKLCYETLRDAVEKDWSASDRSILKECHLMLGDALLSSARDALKEGKSDVNMLRLRNASASYRRAAIMDPGDKRGATGLVKVARAACAVESTFDNFLMLGGAYLLVGDVPHARAAYDECATFAPADARLKQAKLLCERKQREIDNSAQPESKLATSARK